VLNAVMTDSFRSNPTEARMISFGRLLFRTARADVEARTGED